MAKVYQPNSECMFIKSQYDLFIETGNGKSVRIHINKDSIEIYPINGVSLELCYNSSCGAGVKFYSA